MENINEVAPYSAIETFFESYANSMLCDETINDADSLCEVIQGRVQGFYFELLSMNDGEFYVVSVHATDDKNVDDFNLRIVNDDTTSYRFETHAEALGVLSAFLAATTAE